MKIMKKHNMNNELLEPIRIDEKRIIDYVYELNNNTTTLFEIGQDNNFQIDDYVNVFSTNIYIVLQMLSEMGVYPDFFFDLVFRDCVEKKKFGMENPKYDSYDIKRKYHSPYNMIMLIRKGINKGFHRDDLSKKNDITSNFNELVSFNKSCNIPIKYGDVEHCRKAYRKRVFELYGLTQNLGNSDFLETDIECLMRLMFEYLSFFADIGIDPTEYVNKLIDKEKERTK